MRWRMILSGFGLCIDSFFESYVWRRVWSILIAFSRRIAGRFEFIVGHLIQLHLMGEIGVDGEKKRC